MEEVGCWWDEKDLRAHAEELKDELSSEQTQVMC
jgi:hypothetical protein